MAEHILFSMKSETEQIWVFPPWQLYQKPLSRRSSRIQLTGTATWEQSTPLFDHICNFHMQRQVWILKLANSPQSSKSLLWEKLNISTRVKSTFHMSGWPLKNITHFCHTKKASTVTRQQRMWSASLGHAESLSLKMLSRVALSQSRKPTQMTSLSWSMIPNFFKRIQLIKKS